MGRRAGTRAELTPHPERHRRGGGSTAAASKVLNGRTDVASATREGVTGDLIRYGNSLHEGGFAAARHLLGRPDRPTAIFVGSDLRAMGAYEAARQADLSVVGSTTCRSAGGCRRRSPRPAAPPPA